MQILKAGVLYFALVLGAGKCELTKDNCKAVSSIKKLAVYIKLKAES